MELYDDDDWMRLRYSELLADYLHEAEENIELKKRVKRLERENWNLKHSRRKRR